jgi:predicted AAA+ superfamily ATPase
MQNLAEDLEVDFKTVKRWLSILENLYVIFSVPPFDKNVARGLKKLQKYYFYDTGQVEGDSVSARNSFGRSFSVGSAPHSQ